MNNPNGLKVRKVQLIVDQIDNLPTLPVVAAKVLALASSEEASARDLTQIIEADQSLTSRILALVNSATFGRARSVTSVSRAVTLLGFEAIRSSVLSLKVFDLFNRKGSAAFRTSFDRVGFWKHSIAVGAASQMIARRLRGINPEEAFVVGLLHDIGKVALDFTLPKTFDQVVRRVKSQHISFMDAENRILGLNHAVIGKRLAQNWAFPETLVNVIWLHHQNPEHLPSAVEGIRLVEVVHLADLLAREQRIGLTSPAFDVSAVTSVAERLNLSLEQIEAIAKRLHSVVAEQVQIMGLEQSDENQLFYESLQGANSELGAINQKLIIATRKLEQQRRESEILLDLSRGLGQAGGLSDLLAVAARAFNNWMDAERCALYLHGPGQAYVEGIVCTSGDAPVEHFLFDTTDSDVLTMLPTPPENDALGFGRAEVRESWLFERLGAMLGRGPFYSLPIWFENQRLGAVVFTQPAQARIPTDGATPELLSIAGAVALSVCRLREQQQLAQLVDELAEANRRATEAASELARRRHLASVGEMAAGAAHEINNPLAVISGRAQMLAETEEDAGRRKSLDIISEQAERASGIISDLMSFARPQSVRLMPTDLTTIARKAVEARRDGAASAGIEVACEFIGDVPPVEVDGRLLQWSVEELIANAIAACKQGNRVIVRLQFDDEERIVTLTVIDDGEGMDHRTLAHACDPFFCGRRAGRGRGLGLAKVQRIAEASHAKLRIDSAAGHGATVQLAFPLDKEAADVRSPVQDAV